MLNQINNLITLRNFISLSLNDLTIQMSNEKTSMLSKKLAALNNAIIELSIDLDINSIINDIKDSSKIKFEKFSTEEVKTVSDMDHIVSKSLLSEKKNINKLKKVVNK